MMRGHSLLRKVLWNVTCAHASSWKVICYFARYVCNETRSREVIQGHKRSRDFTHTRYSILRDISYIFAMILQSFLLHSPRLSVQRFQCFFRSNRLPAFPDYFGLLLRMRWVHAGHVHPWEVGCVVSEFSRAPDRNPDRSTVHVSERSKCTRRLYRIHGCNSQNLGLIRRGSHPQYNSVHLRIVSFDCVKREIENARES